MEKIILALAAELAGGKGATSKYLAEKHSASSYRFSTILRDVLDRVYLPHLRDNMQTMSTVLRQNFGEDILAKTIFEDIKKDPANIVTLDGVRREEDIKYLKGLPGFKLVYIDTSIEKRYERMVNRNENPDDKTKTFEQFKIDQEKEADAKIKDLKNIADIVVDNNQDQEHLHAQLDEIIKNLSN